MSQTVSDGLAELTARVRRSTVAVSSRPGGWAAGVIWQPDGLIVTNSHVMQEDVAEVEARDGRRWRGRLVRRDEEHDLAALRIDADGLDAVPIGESDQLRVGQLVAAVGHPWGQRWTVTAGIVMSTPRAALESSLPLEESIRADLRLAPGNSGGPLVDAHGHVVGVNSMVAGGIAVAVPSSAVCRFLSEQVEAGFLGVAGRVVDLRPASFGGGPLQEGLLLTDVVPGSAAERAGLIPGDIVVSVNNAVGVEAVARALRKMRAGDALNLTIVRAGSLQERQAVPAARAA
jgi:serine protease Do